MFVMPLVADMDADVVKDRRVLEPLALAVGQAMNRPRLIEERHRQSCHLGRVLRPVIAALAQLEDAAPPDIRIAIGLRDLLPVLRDVIENEAFTQRQVAQCDIAGAEAPQDFVDEDDAGDDEVGAARLETRNPEPLFQADTDNGLAQAADLFRRDAPVAE